MKQVTLNELSDPTNLNEGKRLPPLPKAKVAKTLFPSQTSTKDVSNGVTEDKFRDKAWDSISKLRIRNSIKSVELLRNGEFDMLVSAVDLLNYLFTSAVAFETRFPMLNISHSP